MAFSNEARQNQWAATFGASATMWSWWRGIAFHDGADWDTPGQVTMTIEDPMDEGLRVSVRLTPAKVFAAFDRCCKEIPSFKGIDREDPDLDAGTADVVLQMAVLGEVVYG